MNVLSALKLPEVAFFLLPWMSPVLQRKLHR